MSKLPSHILKALRDNHTSLGEHPSFPPEDDDLFLVELLTRVFNELSEKTMIENYETAKNELSTMLSQCKKIESKNIEQLEQLCARIVTELFQIPSDTITLEMKIVDHVNTDNQRLLPEKTKEDFSFEDISDMNRLSDEIYKRRMLNVLVTGAAMYYTRYIWNYIKDIFDISPELPSLYKKIIDLNTLLLYYEKNSLNEKETMDGGKVDVTVTSENEFPIINAEGLLFPILVEETIKGLLELAVSNGLPQDIEKAKYVTSKADFKLAELWDMRIGYALWKLIEHEAKRCDIDLIDIGVNFFLMELSEMDCEEFNDTLKEIFAKTKKGRQIIIDVVDKITYNKDKDDFNDYIKTKNDSTILVDDEECFEPEELLTDDDYFTSEELITDDYDYKT